MESRRPTIQTTPLTSASKSVLDDHAVSNRKSHRGRSGPLTSSPLIMGEEMISTVEGKNLNGRPRYENDPAASFGLGWPIHPHLAPALRGGDARPYRSQRLIPALGPMRQSAPLTPLWCWGLSIQRPLADKRPPRNQSTSDRRQLPCPVNGLPCPTAHGMA